MDTAAQAASDPNMAVEPLPLGMWLFVGGFFLVHMIPVWAWLGSILTAPARWRRTYYMATTQKIIIRTGLIGSEYEIIYYPDISNVQLRVGLLDRLFKVGDVHFSINGMNTGRSSRSFYDIDNPQGVFPALQKIVMDIRTDMYYPNQLRPGMNPGYTTGYEAPKIDRD